jgi:hypothetical protein
MYCPLCDRPYLIVNGKRTKVTHATFCPVDGTINDRRLRMAALTGEQAFRETADLIRTGDYAPDTWR